MVLTSSFQSLLPETTTTAEWCALALVPVTAWLLARASSPTDKSARLPVALPGTLPVIGNLLEILRHRQARHDWFTRIGEQLCGRPFTLRMPGRPPATVVYTPQHVEDVLKTFFDNVPKGPLQRDILHDLFGHGIFAVDDAKWVHQRKTASHLFTARALRDSMASNMGKYAIVLVRMLQQACDTHATIDLFKLLNRFTIEAFAKMGFGIDMGCLESDEEHPFQSAFENAQRIVVGRTQRPVWFWKLQRTLNVGVEKRLKEDIAVIDKIVLDIVAQSLAMRQAQVPQLDGQGDNATTASPSGNIVSLFLDRHDASEASEREAFDPTYLRDVVVNFLIAGRDTTAQAMSWCFYNLSSHPEVVKKIRAEIADVLPELASGIRTEPPTMEETQQLVYLEAVLKETLRLHPSVPLVPKAVANDTLLTDGTLLRGGTVLAVSTYAMGRMEFVWGPDAKQFKPERFIDPETNKLINVSAYKFASFNAGPRMCLGMNLAMLEMKIVLASVLSRFDVQLVPGQRITYDNSLTLPVKGEMLVRIHKAGK